MLGELNVFSMSISDVAFDAKYTPILTDDDYDESVAERDNYKSNHDSDSPVRSASEAGCE